MSTDMVKYTPMNLDDLEKQEREIGFGAGGGQFFQWKDGRNQVRILPGLYGKPAFVTFWKHFVKAGATDGKAFGGPCPLKMAKKPCPVCAIAAKLSRGSDADRELADDMSARSRVIANIIDRANPDAGPQVAEFGKSIYDQVKDIFRSLGEDPTHPGEGFDLIVEKTGSGLRTEYKVTPLRKNSPLHPDARQLNEWLDTAPDLGQYVIVQEEHEVANRLRGTVVAHMLGNRGEAKPAPRAGTTNRASAKQAMDIDVDDDPDHDKQNY